MLQTAAAPENIPGLSPTFSTESPNTAPKYQKCLLCEDNGAACRGFDITSLATTAEVREYHRAFRKAKKIPLKEIHDAAPQISSSTINEYFGSEQKDYKWTTVTAIHEAMLRICCTRAGLPHPVHSCPSSSSEARQKLAAAELKVAAAELLAAQRETDAGALRVKLSEVKGKHIAQLEQIQAAHAKDMEWMKDEIRLWRRFAFVLLAVGLVVLVLLVLYIGWDLAHPASGLIRN